MHKEDKERLMALHQEYLENVLTWAEKTLTGDSVISINLRVSQLADLCELLNSSIYEDTMEGSDK